MLALRRGHASIKLPTLSSLARASAYTQLTSQRAKGTPWIRPQAPIPSRAFKTSSQWRQQATAAAIEEDIVQEVDAQRPPPDSQINAQIKSGPVTQFEELSERGLVCRTVVDTLTAKMGLKTMTQVQSMTINETLKGIDVLAQARTGTGKTLAFLIPVLQNIINYDPSLEKRTAREKSASTDIRAIVISPTRELAEQIAVEAQKVTKDTGVIVQTAVGGTQKSLGLRKIRFQGCHILVGTPGRLNDLLSDPHSGVRAPNLSALVLDEADRLLDQGFAPEIRAIQDLLPRREDVDRQTLLFSATVPREVMQIVRSTMKRNFKFVRTVQEGEQQTHEKVPQRLVQCKGFENQIPALVELAVRELSNPDVKRPFKAIVYFGSTADVSLASAIMRQLQHGNDRSSSPPMIPRATQLIEMHAKLDQRRRTYAAETFRRAESGIMLSSDVTARGMDFPNVTHVIQIGLPPSEEQYVHRIGRTARGDKTGEGWLLTNDLETREIRYRLRGMPLEADHSLETAQIDMTQESQLPEQAAKILTKVAESTNMVPRLLKVKAYMAALGLYQWFPNKQVMLDAMNKRSQFGWGMREPPAIGGSLAMKLGLHRLQGVNIGYEDYEEPKSSPLRRDRGYQANKVTRGGGDRDFRSDSRSRGGYGREGSRDFGGRRKSFVHPQDDGDGMPNSMSGRGRGGYERARRY